MQRRQFLQHASVAVASSAVQLPTYAWIPLLSWFGRIAAAMFERQAAATLVRGTAARALAGQAVRSAATPTIVAMRAARAAMVLRNLTAITIGTIAIDEVLAQVQGTPEDSILRWTLAYYAVLTQSDADAAMGMWVDPPHKGHFKHLNQGISKFTVTELHQQTRTQVIVAVSARNTGQTETQHRVSIDWTETEHGYRISDFKTV